MTVLDEQLDRLDEVVTLGRGRLPDDVAGRAAALADRARQRLARSREHVVVTFAGGTGSGKSSLLNAIVGVDVATVGVRRPTTEHALAVVVDGDDGRVDALLDWLDVPERRRLDHGTPRTALAGAVLIDLPDVDSVATAHHVVAARLVDRTDVLVWVTDPLKYASARSHHDFLGRLARHAEVVLVTLHHADRLRADEREACLADLRRLLREDGLGDARLLATSAADGTGVEQVRRLLGEEVRARRAPTARLRADLAVLDEQLSASMPDARLLALADAPLRDRLAAAGDGPSLVDSARRRYRAGARRAVWSPLRQMLAGLLAALGALGRLLRQTITVDAAGPGRPPAVSEAAVRRALHDRVDALADLLPAPAATRLRSCATERADTLTAQARLELGQVRVRPAPRRWWAAVHMLRVLLEAVAVVGAAWLALRGLAAWLALPDVPMPIAVGAVPWPTALLIGGAVASLVTGLVARVGARMGERRHAAQVRHEVDHRLAAAVDRALAPLRDELDACRRLAVLVRR